MRHGGKCNSGFSTATITRSKEPAVAQIKPGNYTQLKISTRTGGVSQINKKEKEMRTAENVTSKICVSKKKKNIKPRTLTRKGTYHKLLMPQRFISVSDSRRKRIIISIQSPMQPQLNQHCVKCAQRLEGSLQPGLIIVQIV